jgi:uncharacterized membrane protein (UPF0127 family)
MRLFAHLLIALLTCSPFACFLQIAHAIELTLEHAATPQQWQWGLMQRPTLPADRAMLFSYRHATSARIWSFNCLMDIDVAFLDQHGEIRELHHLHAYPEKMDPMRPVYTLDDIAQYPPTDPIYQFFLQHAVVSRAPCWHTLELSPHAVQQWDIQVGDRLLWKDCKGWIIKKKGMVQRKVNNV